MTNNPRLIVSEYNQDQLVSFRAIRDGCLRLAPSEIARLKDSLGPYLAFRKALDEFQLHFFEPLCKAACYDTGVSGCCGFESIFTFFADQLITFLLSEPAEQAAIFEVLKRPNTTGHCVYLGGSGCIWKLSPVGCAMFLCDTAKDAVFSEHPEAEAGWKELSAREKDFTWPDKPVLFNDLEKVFRDLGVDTPHMYFHRSPGLLRLKRQAGLA